MVMGSDQPQVASQEIGNSDVVKILRFYIQLHLSRVDLE